MKRFITLLTILIVTTATTFAQQATVKVEFLNNLKAHYRLYISKYELRSGLLNYTSKSVKIDKANSTFTASLTEPTFVIMYCYDPNKEGMALSYQLYLSPNDELDFKADLANLDQISVTGKGSQNNQPCNKRTSILKTCKLVYT